MAANPSVAFPATNGGQQIGSCTTDAVRKSVSKTAKGYGSAVAASAVFSTTKNLVVAYPTTECNIPAVP